ncbi:hypothetical protein ONS96_013646 [Cadophora gregata f. sp. sojae]|nr:hypothetical protein ONS96_013646 [Cadophora gregata f. sp. sojae]
MIRLYPSSLPPFPLWGNSMLNPIREFARPMMINAEEAVTGVAKKTTPFGEEILVELFDSQACDIAISPTNIPLDPTKALDKKAAESSNDNKVRDSMLAITKYGSNTAEPMGQESTSQTSFGYKAVTNPLMSGNSLIRR